MEEGGKNVDVVIPDPSNIDVIQDHGIHNQSIIVEDQAKNVEKQAVGDKSNLKSTTLQEMPDENVQVLPTMVTYTAPIMVNADLPPSVCPVEPMDRSAHSVPRLAMAPTPHGVQSTSQLEGDDINQAWFTTKEDKDNLQGKGVKWRQGMWSKEESELLQNNILQYCKSRGISNPHEVIFKQSKEERKTFYRTIAKGIHRPLFAIYRRVLRTYETGNYNGKYTPEEVAKLKELKRKYGNDWTAIGMVLGRSASSVKDRCRLLNEKCSSGKWTSDEEDRLSQAVHELTSTVPGENVTTGILWTDVARKVGTRSEKQCRSKWLNYLNWKECGGKEWNKTDEIDLIKKIYNLGVQNESEIDWAALADGWSSARSPQWLRSKWWTIKKPVPQSFSFSDTISYLHTHYARSLKHRLNRHDSKFLQLPTAEPPLTLITTGTALSPLTTCATVSTSVGHAITVDGEIYIARGEDKGSEGINTYEMVHLRPLPNTDPSQPTSYIIEPVQCSVTGSATSYVLQQASQDQGTKFVKISSSSGTVRQVIPSNADASSQQKNTRGDIQPAVVSSLPSSSSTDVVTTRSVKDRAGNMSATGEEVVHVTKSYGGKRATDILQQDQQLECVSEEEISTTVHQENETSQELENSAEHNDGSRESLHNALSYDHRPAAEPTSPGVTQALEMNFSTSDSTIYSHSLVPSLVTNSPPAQIITNEVIMSQPTLPEHILQTQGDEPTFLADSTIVVSSPLAIVDGALAEVTVTSGVSGIVMENEMSYFK